MSNKIAEPNFTLFQNLQHSDPGLDGVGYRSRHADLLEREIVEWSRYLLSKVPNLRIVPKWTGRNKTAPY
jgi:hypothetical protein